MFISGKVCFLTLIEAKRQTLSEINLQGQFVVKGGKFKLSAQGRDLTPFLGNAMGPKSKYLLRLSYL